ncbi:unnamed protein product [Phyllotreta striolata]|uniref:C2H2-type domain-containing protein n=1 Tax=Phyllotreta striolata TaxID=444603 RepID=A0A9N9TFQ7_PHYSR|nr:unnamed protein product [Phyllotreta striolata]
MEEDWIKVEIKHEYSDEDSEFIDCLKSVDNFDYGIETVIKREREQLGTNKRRAKSHRKCNCTADEDDSTTETAAVARPKCNVNSKTRSIKRDIHKRYNCDVCRRNFPAQRDLKNHLCVLDAAKRYTCHECDQPFDDKVKLKRHILKHSGRKEFKCNACDKAFYLNKHLTQHRLTHTGEKKFKCGICERSFSQSGHLKTHLVTHTGERKFRDNFNQIKVGVLRYHIAPPRRGGGGAGGIHFGTAKCQNGLTERQRGGAFEQAARNRYERGVAKHLTSCQDSFNPQWRPRKHPNPAILGVAPHSITTTNTSISSTKSTLAIERV